MGLAQRCSTPYQPLLLVRVRRLAGLQMCVMHNATSGTNPRHAQHVVITGFIAVKLYNADATDYLLPATEDTAAQIVSAR